MFQLGLPSDLLSGSVCIELSQNFKGVSHRLRPHAHLTLLSMMFKLFADHSVWTDLLSDRTPAKGSEFTALSVEYMLHSDMSSGSARCYSTSLSKTTFHGLTSCQQAC